MLSSTHPSDDLHYFSEIDITITNLEVTHRDRVRVTL